MIVHHQKTADTSRKMINHTFRADRYSAMAGFFGLVIIACALLIISPVQAVTGTKYMAGSPELSAYISGSNEVSPGDTVQLESGN